MTLPLRYQSCRGILFVLLAAFGVVSLPSRAIAEENSGSGQSEPTYEYFLHLRHNQVGRRAESTSLVMTRILPVGGEQHDLHAKRNLQINFEPVGVFGGKVYFVASTDLFEVDVATGDVEMIGSYIMSPIYRPGRIVALARSRGVGQVLRIYDLASRSLRDVPTEGSGGWEPPVAVSPDGRRAAFFQIYQGPNIPTTFRLKTIDLDRGVVGEVGPNLFSMRFSTGGGSMTEGPPFVWLDAKTILVVRDEDDKTSRPMIPGAGAGAGGSESEPLVATMNVESGATSDVLRLPRFLRGLYEPYLRPLGPDGVPRAVVGSLGQFRLDLDAKRVLADNTLGGEFQWIRGTQPERLLFGQTELFRADSILDVSVSPDGRRVAWLTAGGSNAEIRCFSAGDEAPRTVAKGWFPNTSLQHRRPEHSNLLWFDRKDLAPVEPTAPPAGFTPFAKEANEEG